MRSFEFLVFVLKNVDRFLFDFLGDVMNRDDCFFSEPGSFRFFWLILCYYGS